MDVGVQHQLTGTQAAVHADIEAGDPGITGKGAVPQQYQQAFGVTALGVIHGEPVGDMAPGDDQQVTGSDGKFVVNREDRAVVSDGAAEGCRGAERAFGTGHGASLNAIRVHARSSTKCRRRHGWQRPRSHKTTEQVII